MPNSIIVTISRQPGCGGLEIGKRLARRLEAAYVDKKTIAEAALSMEPMLHDFEPYTPEVGSIKSDQPVHEREEELLLELIGDGSCVVVGRAGYHRLKDKPDVVHLFLCAGLDYRIKNYERLFHLSKTQAETLLRETDQATERYLRNVTGKEMYDIRNFDLVINVGEIDFNCAIELILDYVYDKFEYQQTKSPHE